MPSNVPIDEELLAEAQKIGGFKYKKEPSMLTCENMLEGINN